MPSHSIELFNYAAGFVSEDDISAYAPADPGYPNYVRVFRNILESRELPRRASFDITETIGLTRWTDADSEKDPHRFRRFRAFTNAVAIALSFFDDIEDDSLPANYTVISLIDDAHALNDSHLLGLLVPAFESLHALLKTVESPESPFILLGILVVKSRLGSSVQELSTLADALIAEEPHHFGRASNDFLWGCTFFDQLHMKWKRIVERFLPPTTDNLSLLRDALLNGGPRGK